MCNMRICAHVYVRISSCLLVLVFNGQGKQWAAVRLESWREQNFDAFVGREADGGVAVRLLGGLLCSRV